MPIYRKNESGALKRTAGNIVQRWNDRLFLTTHSISDGADYYDIEPSAFKYITGLTDYTEFQLYINTPNESKDVYIRFGGKTLKLTMSNSQPISIGSITKRLSIYTLDTSDNKIWFDVGGGAGGSGTTVFVGTREEYDVANAAGQIPSGILVIITDEEEEIPNSSTTAVLGMATLGSMILGHI